MNRVGLLVWLTPIGFLMTGTVPCGACTVPVFRYALDRWQPSMFAVEAATVDLDNPPPWLEGFYERDDINLSFLAADSKDAVMRDALYGNRSAEPLWQGMIDEASLKELVDSPMRRKFIENMLSGDSAVWFYVGGRTAEDDKRVSALETRLKYFSSVAELPEINTDDPTNWMGPGPELSIRFSVLRIYRDDEDEKLLIRMLQGPDPDETTTAAFVAPVFGRGRVLVHVDAQSLDTEAIDELCFYLTGACSCQVKDQNPGWDLLLTVNWDEALQKAENAWLASSVGEFESDQELKIVDSGAQGATETVVFKPQMDEVDAESQENVGNNAPVFQPLLLVAIASVGVWLLAWGFRNSTQGRHP